jgi:hypothetical protein
MNWGWGRLRTRGYPVRRAVACAHWNHWRRIEQATMGYGYGLSASLLQLAQAYTVFANDGVIVPATVHRLDAPATGHRLYSARTAQEVRAMMQRVVSANGTAPDAVVNGFSVAGKTGTAYRWTSHGYDRSQYRASFVGIIPAVHPRVIIAVSIDNPRKGSHLVALSLVRRLSPLRPRRCSCSMFCLTVPLILPGTCLSPEPGTTAGGGRSSGHAMSSALPAFGPDFSGWREQRPGVPLPRSIADRNPMPTSISSSWCRPKCEVRPRSRSLISAGW